MASLFSRTVACAVLVWASIAVPVAASPVTAAPAPFTCTTEGYHGDPDDPQKYHRCVDFGDGVLRQFDFDCGEGMVWDDSLTTCNYAFVVEPEAVNG